MSEKKYHIESERYYGRPGHDIHESLKQFFADYYSSDKRHEVSIELNGVLVTMKRKGF